MRPAPFEYLRPATLADALSAMAGGAVPLAGGQSLIQSMRLRQAAPAALVDLASVAELDDTVGFDGRTLHVGARVTHAALAADPLVAKHCPWLAQAALALGDAQVRHRGTVLGNLCWADPRANFVVACSVMDGAVHVAAADAPGETTALPLAGFFTGFRGTALAGRLAVRLELEVPAGDPRGRYMEFSRQRQDLALVNCCVVCDPAADDYRIAVGGIAEVPVRLRVLEDALAAGGPAAATRPRIAEAISAVALASFADAQAGADYRRHLAAVISHRALRDCLGTAA